MRRFKKGLISSTTAMGFPTATSNGSSSVDLLQEQPESGRMVPEHRAAHVREIVFRPYRIVYRVNHDHKRVEIARVWHAARGTPEIPSA